MLEALPPQPAAEIIEAAGIDVWYRVEIHHHQLGLFENNEKQLAVFSRFKPTIRLPESTGAEVSP